MSKLQDLIDKLCPNGVGYKKLKELIIQNPKSKIGAKKAENFEKGNYPFYTSGKTIYYTKEFFVSGENIFVNDGGQADIKYYNGKSAYADHVISFKPIENVNGRFIYHYLMKFKDYINEKMFRGSGIKNIQRKEFFDMLIPVPPLEVQCEIVRILDAFTLLTAELTAELTARKQQFAYFEEKLLFNTEFEKVKLSDLCVVNQGLQIPINKRKLEPGEDRYFYITVQFLKGGNENYYIENPQASVICNKDDILVTRTGSTGKIITGVEGCFHNNFFKVEPNNKVLKRYLYFVLNSKMMYNKMLAAASGGTVPDLPHKKFYNLEIFLPSIDEQKKIVNILEKIYTISNDITEGLPAEIELRKKQYEYYRDKLLTFKELDK